MKEIQLQKSIEPNLPKVQCDFKQIQQVFLNLVYNASEAMANGGTLTVTANRASGSKEFLEVVISDTGSGIPKADLPHIFDRFYRGDRSRQEGNGESGLGLAIAKSIVVAHDGTIAVTSTPGTGTTFTISLPG